MKTGSFWSWSLAVGLVAVPLIGGCLRTVPPPSQTVASAESTVIETDPGITLAPSPETPATHPPPVVNVEEARVQPLPAEFVLPPNVQPGKSLTDLIRLAQSGGDEGVMLAFVTNSPSPFNPGADDLIYLQDIGVPGNVVSAMMLRDKQLKATPAASAPAPAPAPEPVLYAAAPTAVAGPPAAPETVPPPPDYVPETAAPPPADVIYPDFYESLSPYGSWVQVDGYGYCWQPAVAGVNPGWQPYFDGGGWVYTDCGWYWRSDYSWGWAPFHYGRWFHHNHWGWCWQPDRVWGPSWVCWRHNDTHCGWAPLPPGTHFTAGVGLTGSLRPVTQLSPTHFRFVEWRYFRDHELAQHAVSRDQGSRIYGQTTVSTHIVVTHGRVINDGLSADRVAVATHTPLTRVNLHDVKPTATAGVHPDRLGNNGSTLSVYRPQVTPVTVSRGSAAGRLPMPKPLVAMPQPVGGTHNLAPAPAPVNTATVTPPRTTLGQHSPALPQQPVAPSHSYRATSRYYAGPNTSAADRMTTDSRSRLPVPSTSEVPRNNPTANSGQRLNPLENTRSRFQVPTTASGQEAFRTTTSRTERPQREQLESPAARSRATSAATPEAARYNPAAVEHSRRETPQVERPARVEPAESRASHASPPPAPSNPAPSRSSSSSDRSDRSDSGSHGRR